MTSYCEKTGLSPEDMNLYRHYHSYLTQKISLSKPANETIKGFSKPLQRLIGNHAQNNNDAKRKERLFNHLEKSLVSKFQSASLVVFGSSASGLSLKSGDYDLCLIIPSVDEKKAIKKISSMLRGQGMDSVESITNAKVPLVKFSDPRSGLQVDISINNSLALHNTKLLEAYCKLDKRVKELVTCVKYWALHRNLCDAWSGTLSSYAWTILVINHLIQENVIPNLQQSDNRTIANVDGIEYDLTINTNASLNDANEAEVAELLASFFYRYATREWDKSVISIRNGGDLTRKEKGWRNEPPSAIEVINSDNTKMGNHHMAIEDPFDIDVDLCRVLRAHGELNIKNELIRACEMFSDGSTWKSICDTVDESRLEHLEPDDLFHDLRDKSDSIVENMLEKTKAEMVSLEKRVNALEDEKHSTIKMAKAMRGVIDETSEIRKEHKSTVLGLKERSELIEEIKSQRDKINSDIILPIHMIEDELSKVYKRLTEELDIHRVPSLEREKEHFSWFIELQAMHAKAREASELHQRFIENINDTVDESRLEHLEPDDLFHDLRDKSDSIVENMLEKTKAEMVSLEKRVNALEDEKHSTIKMAKAMRGVIDETSEIRKEHKSTVLGLKERSELIEEIKSQRDKINSDIILPIHMIEDELSKVYKRLTEELDIHRVPSLEREKEHFSWFIELQAMHAKAREASELHQRFIENINLQKSEIAKLKIYETQHDDATKKLLEQEPLLKDKNVNRKEVISFDRRVQKLQKVVRQRRTELHKLRREVGRLEAWMRKKSSKNKNHSKRKNHRGRKSSGTSKPNAGPVTLGDISGLLSAVENEGSSKKVRKINAKKAGMRKLGNLSAHRGERGSFKRKD